MDDISIDVSHFNNDTIIWEIRLETVKSIISWFSITIGILGVLIIIIAFIRGIYVRNKRKKLIVEGELSNYLKFDATSGRVHESELATDTVQL